MERKMLSEHIEELINKLAETGDAPIMTEGGVFRTEYLPDDKDFKACYLVVDGR